MQLVARNREYSKGLNNVPCVVWSCNKLHATHEIMNAQKGLNNVPCVVWSCIKMHATSDGARFLTRAFLYLSVIGTRCEVCAIKFELLASLFASYKTKVRWIFRVFLTPPVLCSSCTKTKI